jgi:hypothetical protein
MLGCDEAQLSVLVNFLELLSGVKERVWARQRERVERFLGLPTIDNVNIVWSARPVFGDDACRYDEIDREDDSHKRFIGLTYLAVLEMISPDFYGQKQRTAIQFTEDQFQRLLRGMKRASDQLGILKEQTKSIMSDV